MLTYADVCQRLLTYADVCWCMLTDGASRLAEGTGRSGRLLLTLHLPHTTRPCRKWPLPNPTLLSPCFWCVFFICFFVFFFPRRVSCVCVRLVCVWCLSEICPCFRVFLSNSLCPSLPLSLAHCLSLTLSLWLSRARSLSLSLAHSVRAVRGGVRHSRCAHLAGAMAL
jgi:hypothetical protein